MARIILFNKPYDVLSQFTDGDHRATLADYIKLKGIYPAGRLDRDSEGLLILTNNGQVQHAIAHPQRKMAKTYWTQVDGIPNTQALAQLRQGVDLKDGRTRPAHARLMDHPPLWPRNPPIRYRANIPDSWIELTIYEGKNRQVRRMTAAVGHPTLRLIRYAIGPWNIEGLQPGQWQEVECPPTLLCAGQPGKQSVTKRPHNKQPAKSSANRRIKRK